MCCLLLLVFGLCGLCWFVTATCLTPISVPARWLRVEWMLALAVVKVVTACLQASSMVAARSCPARDHPGTPPPCGARECHSRARSTAHEHMRTCSSAQHREGRAIVLALPSADALDTEVLKAVVQVVRRDVGVRHGQDPLAERRVALHPCQDDGARLSEVSPARRTLSLCILHLRLPWIPPRGPRGTQRDRDQTSKRRALFCETRLSSPSPMGPHVML